MDVSQITAIVTGGCSGLGHATAITLREAGAKVALFDLNDDTGAQRVSELGSDHTRFYKVDVRDENQVQAGPVVKLCSVYFKYHIRIRNAPV